MFLALAACSSTTIINHVGGDADGGVDETDGGVATDDGGTTTTKDAGTTKKDAGVQTGSNPQPLPIVPFNGGTVLANISLVTVTFDGDSFRSNIEAFDSTIGTTAWWNAARAGYCDAKGNCVGPATPHATKPTVHLAAGALQNSYTDSASGGGSSIKTMIDTNIKNGTFPTPTPNTLYNLYFPASTTINLDGTPSCQGFGGYHNSMTSGGVTFAYSIMPRCSTGMGTQADFDYLTTAASHELAEAATDPFISTDPQSPYTGFGGFTDAWDVPAGGEVGDRCFDLGGTGADLYKEGKYTVQRIWSNGAAKLGHDPCVPAPAPATEPYYNVATLASTGDVISIAIGGTATIPIQAISDAPIAGQLAFDAIEITQQLGKGSNVLSVVSTSPAGGGIYVGAKGSVTVKLNSNPTQGVALLLLRAQRFNSGGSPIGSGHYWPVIVQAQ
jgi:hypothetical protein